MTGKGIVQEILIIIYYQIAMVLRAQLAVITLCPLHLDLKQTPVVGHGQMQVVILIYIWLSHNLIKNNGIYNNNNSRRD